MKSIVGITGNICSGKSSVASILKGAGAKVSSYDTFLYGVYSDSQCKADLIDCFGNEILDGNQIERTLLKMYLKDHPEDCKKLWNITDKYALPKVENFLNETSGLCFFECAPLYENSLDKFCEKVVVCYTPDDLRINRLIWRAKNRDGFILSREKAMAVIQQQTMSQEEKMARADFIIFNDGNFSYLEKQTLDIYKNLGVEK